MLLEDRGLGARSKVAPAAQEKMSILEQFQALKFVEKGNQGCRRFCDLSCDLPQEPAGSVLRFTPVSSSHAAGRRYFLQLILNVKAAAAL